MTTNVDFEPNINSVYMFAFRYALGRRTFAPNIVCDFLSEKLNILSDFTLNQMIKEIEECPDLGDECDKRTWEEFVDCIRGELCFRENNTHHEDAEERITWHEKPTDFKESVKNALHEQISKTDSVNHPSHYTDGNIEVIDYIEDKKLNYHLGNVVKYVSRAGKKDESKTIEDLKKARWYLDRYISMLEG